MTNSLVNSSKAGVYTSAFFIVIKIEGIKKAHLGELLKV